MKSTTSSTTGLSRLSDQELVRILLVDEMGRLDVVEYLFDAHRDALMRVGKALYRQYGFVPAREDIEELASIVVEAVAELLRCAQEPSETFRAVAEGDPEFKLELLPYLKGIVRNKVKQRFRKLNRHSSDMHGSEPEESQVVHPDFEHRDSIARIRELIDSIPCSSAERIVAELYKSALPDKPGFAAIKEALGTVSEKAARRTAERFEAKLRKVVAAKEQNESLTLRERQALVLGGLYLREKLKLMRENGRAKELPSGGGVSVVPITAAGSVPPQQGTVPVPRAGRGPQASALPVAPATPAAQTPWSLLGGACTTCGAGGLGLKGWAVVAFLVFSSVTLVLQPLRSESDSETSFNTSALKSASHGSGGAAAVPEPTSTMLIGLSTVLLTFVRRR